MIKKFFNYGGMFFLGVLVMGGVLLSNKAGVNFSHHHSLPAFDKNKIMCSGTFAKTCHIRLGTKITKPEDYRDVLHLLTTASKEDKIYFYLIGQGGQVWTLMQLANSIQNSKAQTVAVVEGDVYSAHAFLAFTMKKIVIRDNVVFMFHASSAYGNAKNYCAKNKGKLDRTRDAYKKCLDFFDVHLRQSNAFIGRIMRQYLTNDELFRVLTGYDVYVTGEEFKKRMKRSK